MNAADAVTVQSNFEKKYPAIKVDLVRMGAPAVLQRILTEHRGGKTFADVVLGFGFVHYELAQQKLLAKYDPPERKNYVGQFKDAEGYWTNVMPIVHTIAYNSKLVPASELPTRYSDLLQPKWQGKMGLNSNNLMFLAGMIAHFGMDAGMDFLQKLAAQSPQVRSGGTLLATLVAAGEFPLGFSINENNVENLKLKGAPVLASRSVLQRTRAHGIVAGAARRMQHGCLLCASKTDKAISQYGKIGAAISRPRSSIAIRSA
jgi:iron(III) transport system substrate-binding protein